MTGWTAATIAAKPWLAAARVLAESFRRWHPDLPFHLLLADEVEGRFDPAREPYRTIPLSDLAIPHAERFRFRHTQQELTYAATPFLISHLLERGFERVLFLKQESLVVGDLGPLFERLDRSSILLTPHLLEPLAGADAVERELGVLLAGVFNVGVLGVSARAEARRFLSWWGERTELDCRHAVEEGLHYEQRWLDLAPSCFEEVEIAREPGANVGHWSLPERRVEVEGERVLVDGGPGRVVRFSGYDPDRPERFTRHSPRLTRANAGPAAQLLARYHAGLLGAGERETRAWPYAFGRFDDGVAIPDVAREIYRELGAAVDRFGDPFAAAAASSFRRYLEEPVDGIGGPARRLTRLWRAVYDRRPDLRRAFPDLAGSDREAFLAWTASSGLREHGVAAELLGQRAR